MVKCIPERLDGSEIPDSENIFFSLLQSLPDLWTVWHSREWIEDYKNRQNFGESDFLVFNPNYGFLVLEVKGGGISYQDGIWYTTNNKGRFKIHDPFKQANRCKHFFRKHYVNSVNIKKQKDQSIDKNDYLHQGDFPGNYNHAVIFPQSPFKDEYTDLIPSVDLRMVFDSNDVYRQQKWMKNTSYQSQDPHSPLEDFLVNLFRKLGHLLKPASGFPENFSRFFIETITPSIKTQYQIHTWLQYQNTALEEVNKEQDKMIELFHLKKHCFFTGSAGTGKTQIALKKLIKDAKSEKKVLFICFNRNLKQYIERMVTTEISSKSLNINKENILITNIDSLIYSFFEEHFVNNPLSKNKARFDDYRNLLLKNKYNQIAEDVQAIMSSEIYPAKYLFDTIIVDEAQDIQQPYWKLFQFLLKDSKKSFFYVFFDPDQSLFNSDFSIQNFGFDVDNDIIQLNHNLRNGDFIVNWFLENSTLGNYQDLAGFTGQKIKVSKSNGFLEALKGAAKSIYDYIFKQNVNPADILILCDQKLKYMDLDENKITYNEKEQIARKRYRITKSLHLSILETQDFNHFQKILKMNQESNTPNEIPIQFSSIGAFKGLESPIVFLLLPEIKSQNIEELKKIRQKLYVGSSRARFILNIYYY